MCVCVGGGTNCNDCPSWDSARAHMREHSFVTCVLCVVWYLRRKPAHVHACAVEIARGQRVDRAHFENDPEAPDVGTPPPKDLSSRKQYMTVVHP